MKGKAIKMLVVFFVLIFSLSLSSISMSNDVSQIDGCIGGDYLSKR